MFVSIKTTSWHEVNFRAERIRNSGAQLFACLVLLRLLVLHMPSKKHATCDITFLRNHEQIMYLKWAFAISKTCQLWNISFQLFFFFRVLLHNRFSAQYFVSPSKGCLVHDTNVHKIFSALNLTIIFLKPCNNNFFSILFKRNYFSMSLIIFF